MNKSGILVFVLCLLSAVSFTQDGFKESSVLKSGSWYKVKVEKTGVYQLNYDDLKSIGIDSPQNIRVYGQTGKQLSYLTDGEFVSDLEEIPLFSSNDINFSSGDYYLFYAEGAEMIYFDDINSVFKQDINDYSKYNYYYITSSFGSGNRIVKSLENIGAANYTSTSYDYVDYFEEEVLNLQGTGRQWFSGSFGSNGVNRQFIVDGIDVNTPLYVEASVAVRSSTSKTVGIYVNNSLLTNLTYSGTNVGNAESIFAYNKIAKERIAVKSSAINIGIEFNGTSLEDKAYLDYITINARSSLTIQGNSFMFRDSKSVGEGIVTEFKVKNGSGAFQIWNVTDHTKTYRTNTVLSGSTLAFSDSTNELKEYIAVNVSAGFNSPIFTDEVLNDVGKLSKKQNLHALTPPELLIVTHPAFLLQANQLAELHRTKDDMAVFVVTSEEVYNEFSSGKPEAAAIRNFTRMLYERSSGQDSLKYLLLFGDGSYDNRTMNDINPNYLPTYQSVESLSPTQSYVSDDFYGLLELGESILSGDLCIGIGRLPVRSDGNAELEAQEVVNKIIQYYDPKVMNDWRNNMIFLGDDGESGWDNEVFMKDSDYLTKIVDNKAPSLNHNKIFMDAFQQISSSTGASYPEVEIALDDAFNKGALVFNYMGHGGEEAITQEQVLTKSDFANLKNAPYFPLFVTATCQMSRFDNVKIDGGQYSKTVSAGEAALLNPDGGAIALLTTTRLVYQSSNKALSNSIYNTMFERDHNGNRLRLGDIFRIAKNSTTASDVNTLKFALLGDPAITLAYGEYKVITDSINNNSVTSVIDTLNALNEIVITGYIANYDSTVLNNFNGRVYISVFDKPYIITTNSNDDIPTIDFTMQDKLLFRGKATVINGRFKYSFKVPKDISYSFGEGKISYYAENEQIDAKGYFKDFIIGGTSTDAEVDMEGPKVSLYMNDANFIDGGVTDSNPVLVAHVFDTNGINTTGNGIGHDLIGILDNDNSKNYLLNDYYIGEIDDYRRGEVRYQLFDLEGGYHTMTVKVWDTYNNSTEEVIGFYVDNSNNLTIRELTTYPNPARTETYFQYAHNIPDQEHTVKIDIFDATGRLVHQINRTIEEGGYVSEPIHWSFSSSGGFVFEPGVYPYRISVTTSDGKEGIQSSRLIIIP